MSTADSQVLACTAAITDDVKPEWNQDNGKTKKVTLAVAVFATAISLVGQLFGFGDSVFVLVVFAVYGLGGIFVPLILIRMAGYEPDSKHTISMMVAALLGVLIWTAAAAKYFDGDWPGGIFPSVPGIGAAFAVHSYCAGSARNLWIILWKIFPADKKIHCCWCSDIIGIRWSNGGKLLSIFPKKKFLKVALLAIN